MHTTLLKMVTFLLLAVLSLSLPVDHVQKYNREDYAAPPSSPAIWMGVTFVMTHRAARALEWLVPEVESACRQQLADLTAYRASVAAVIARVSSAYTGGDIARSVNRAYLLFFLPFWWEHILLRGALAPEDLEKEARALLQSSSSAADAAPRALAPAVPRAPGPSLAAAPALLPPAGPRSGTRLPRSDPAGRRVPDAAPNAPAAPRPSAGRPPHGILRQDRVRARLRQQLRYHDHHQPAPLLVRRFPSLPWAHALPLRMPVPLLLLPRPVPRVDRCGHPGAGSLGRRRHHHRHQGRVARLSVHPPLRQRRGPHRGHFLTPWASRRRDPGRPDPGPSPTSFLFSSSGP
jgi:hypothetical protein